MRLKMDGVLSRGGGVAQRLSRLLTAPAAGMGRRAGDRELLDGLAACEPRQRKVLLQAFLRAQVSQVLRVSEGKLHVEASLTSLGMDSLMGLELRNRVRGRSPAKSSPCQRPCSMDVPKRRLR